MAEEPPIAVKRDPIDVAFVVIVLQAIILFILWQFIPPDHLVYPQAAIISFLLAPFFSGFALYKVFKPMENKNGKVLQLLFVSIATILFTIGFFFFSLMVMLIIFGLSSGLPP